MPKSTAVFICQVCGARARQFFGRCPECGSWNSLVEQSQPADDGRRRRSAPDPEQAAAPRRSTAMASLEDQPLQRLATGSAEFDRVLGGGLVPGSLVLVGGDPGIGKSTLLLQSASAMAAGASVLYVSAEESAQQVKLRWQRLAGGASELQLLAETDLELVLEELEALRPAVAIIDSIQALHDANLTSAPGSVGQVRELCGGAATAGETPEHLRCCWWATSPKKACWPARRYWNTSWMRCSPSKGDRFASHRLLRAVKNRFGATHELGLFEMQSGGLAEVGNPSELFLSDARASGVATIVACEGTRSLVVDLQALVNVTSYASPRRTATGIGTNRLHQILAVLEKHMGLPLSRFDCYLAVAGGLEVEEPAADLGVAAAVVASFRDLTLPAGTVLIGELGLGGQLRPVGQLELRLQEAARLGFQRAVVPRGSGLGDLASGLDLALLEADSVTEALVLALGDAVQPDQD